MESDDPFARLLEAWRGGSADALGELLTQNTAGVRAAVRRRLPDRLRGEYDSLDFVQAVWASVARMPADRYRFATPDALAGFLARVAEWKVIETVRHRVRDAVRDANREARSAVHGQVRLRPTRLRAEPEPVGDRGGAVGEHGPLPARRPPGGGGTVRDGYTHQEIATLSGISVRSVERIVQRLKELCNL